MVEDLDIEDTDDCTSASASASASITCGSSKKRRIKKGDGNEELESAATILGHSIEKSAIQLSSRDSEISKKRTDVVNEVMKMTSLTDEAKIRVCGKLVVKEEWVELFLSLPTVEMRGIFVSQILDGSI